MLIKDAIERMQEYRRELEAERKRPDINPFTHRELGLDIEAVKAAVTCMLLIEGGRKVV